MNNLLNQSSHCARQGCLQIGKWLPILIINLVGQTDAEKPVTCAIPMFLCDKCKGEFEPSSALTFTGKAQLAIKVALIRRKKINWDTLRVEWRTDDDAKRVIH